MIDHFNLPVSDLTRSRDFYAALLRPLGYEFILQDGRAVGFGKNSWRFGLIETPKPFPALHLAFEASSRAHVSRFFDAAVSAGATPNGSPGLRPQYDPDYFAAFVLDPDGHNVEAVCRMPD
jgi:catechol 2,3-dioxygenase-like lactoylglutathione lyase family enzyme